jgi:heme oxygenase
MDNGDKRHQEATEMNSLNMQSLLHHLREATAASHATLDGAFGSLDLATRGDYVRFLSGHAIGMAPLYASFHTFVTDDLGMDCPDYPAMLRQDLAALGVDGSQLPAIDPAAELTPQGSGYVVAGSRLGLAMIRKGGYWGKEHALPSSYMEDEAGLAIWKAAAANMKQDLPSADEAGRQSIAAVAAFETFRAAFEASAELAAV